MRKKIILASASPRRKELLSQIGVTFEIIKAEKEEHITSSIPTEVVKELSMQKAKEVAAKCDSSIIIGADTIVAMEGQILGKPKDRADAMRMLRLLQGKKHQVITGVTVLLGSTKTRSCAYQTDDADISRPSDSIAVCDLSESLLANRTQSPCYEISRSSPIKKGCA